MNVINNKIQAFFFTISFLTFIVQSVILCMTGYKEKILLLLFCPVVLIIGLFILENIKKNVKWIQSLSIVLCILIIVFLQFTIYSIILFGNLYDTKSINPTLYKVTSPSKYYSIKSKYNRILKFFPKRIPDNAKDIEFYFDSNSFFGSYIVKLKFSTDKVFLNNEIKKYKYIKKETLLKDTKLYKMSYARNWVFNENLNSKEIFSNYKIYVIGDNTTDSSCHRSCEYGLAINEDTNTIIYYYSNPD